MSAINPFHASMMKAFRFHKLKQRPRLPTVPRKSKVDLSKYDSPLVKSMLASFGFESPALAHLLLSRYSWLEADFKSPPLKDVLTEKITLLHDLGIPSTEVLENCEMLLVSIDQIVDRYHFLADAGIDPDEISAPLIKEMGNGLNYDQRDRLLQFIREIYPHRSNCEYLASSLLVPLRDVHDAAAVAPKMLTEGYKYCELLLRLKTMGMSTTKILGNYNCIQTSYNTKSKGWLSKRLDFVQDSLGDQSLVAEYLQKSAIFMQEAYFQPNFARFRRIVCQTDRSKVDEKDPYYDDRLDNMREIGKWGQLPEKPLEHMVNTSVGIGLGGIRSPASLAESSEYLQSIGISPEAILRLPRLLGYSKLRLEDAVELIKETFGQETIRERDLPKLMNLLTHGIISKREIIVYDFVYRDLGESLDTEPQTVKNFLSGDEFARISVRDYFRTHPFSAIESLKTNVKRLRETGFSVDSLLSSLLVLLIPTDELEDMIEEILGEEDIPIKLDLNLEKKMLNMMQYRYEYDKYF